MVPGVGEIVGALELELLPGRVPLLGRLFSAEALLVEGRVLVEFVVGVELALGRVPEDAARFGFVFIDVPLFVDKPPTAAVAVELDAAAEVPFVVELDVVI
jgi:hypothetical protein